MAIKPTQYTNLREAAGENREEDDLSDVDI